MKKTLLFVLVAITGLAHADSGAGSMIDWATSLFSTPSAKSQRGLDLTDNCRIELRGRNKQDGTILFSPIFSTKGSEGLDFINPKDNKPYRLRVFSNPSDSTRGVTEIDAIIQDMTVKSYSTLAPFKETTTADGYVAHTALSITSMLPKLVIASELNEIVAICTNIDVQ